MTISYIIATFIIGIYVARRNTTVQELLIAKRNIPFILIAPLCAAELLGGSGTVGSTTEAMSMGLSTIWSTIGLSLGCICFVIFFSRFYRALSVTRGVISMPEAYQIRFDKKTRMAMLIILSFSYSILFALQPISAASILAPMFGIEINTVIYISGAIFICVAVVGGIKGISWMNIVHIFFIIFGMLIVALLSVDKAGGMDAIASRVPPEFLTLNQPSSLSVVLWVLGGTLSQMASAVMLSICLGGRELRKTQIGTVLGALILIPFSFLPALIGISAHVTMPDIVVKTALFEMANSISPLVSGLASMAVVAAIFSTAPALLLVVTATMTQDFYKGLINPKANEKQALWFARISTIVIGIVVTVLSTRLQSVFKSTVAAMQIRAVGGFVLLIGIFWPRVNGTAAFWAILGGGVLAAVWYFIGNPFGIEPLLPAVLFSIAVIVPLSLLSKDRIAPGYSECKNALEEFNSMEATKGRYSTVIPIEQR